MRVGRKKRQTCLWLDVDILAELDYRRTSGETYNLSEKCRRFLKEDLGLIGINHTSKKARAEAEIKLSEARIADELKKIENIKQKVIKTEQNQIEEEVQTKRSEEWAIISKSICIEAKRLDGDRQKQFEFFEKMEREYPEYCMELSKLYMNKLWRLNAPIVF